MSPLHSLTTVAAESVGQTRKKEMDMIGLNRQFNNCPPLLSRFPLDEGLTVVGDTPPKHGLAAFGTPDQVVDDKVDAVFISLIIHVDVVLYNDILINRNVLLKMA